VSASRARALQLIPAIHRATHRIGLYIARAKEFGVTQAEAHILDHLAAEGDCTVGELHRAFGHRRSTLTSVLDRLWERKLIVRDPGEVDRRTFIIRLTPQGRELAARIHSQLQQIEAQVMKSVSSRDLASLPRVLAALERAVRADEQEK